MTATQYGDIEYGSETYGEMTSIAVQATLSDSGLYGLTATDAGRFGLTLTDALPPD